MSDKQKTSESNNTVYYFVDADGNQLVSLYPDLNDIAQYIDITKYKLIKK